VFCLAIQREFVWNDEQLFDSMMRGCPTTNPDCLLRSLIAHLIQDFCQWRGRRRDRRTVPHIAWSKCALTDRKQELSRETLPFDESTLLWVDKHDSGISPLDFIVCCFSRIATAFLSRRLFQYGGVDRQLSQALAGCGKDRVDHCRDDQ